MRRVAFIVIFFTLLASSLSAYVAKSINVYGLYGEDRDNLIISLQYIKVDKQFDRYDLRKEIENLYKTGSYETIDAELRPLDNFEDSGYVSVNFYVEKKKKIKDLLVEGFESRKIIKKLGLKKKKYFSATQFSKGLKEVREYLIGEGYLDAEIDTELITDTETVVVKLKIHPGPRYVLSQVKYKLDGVSKKRIDRYFHFKLNKPYKFSMLEKGKERLEKYFNKKNYLGYSVTYSYEKQDGRIYIKIQASSGARYKVRDIIFKGLTLFDKKMLLKQLPIQKGKLFSKKLLQQSRAKLYNLYYEKGYILANIENDFVLDTKKKEVDVIFEFKEGEQIFINDIYITGNTKTQEYVIKRELLFKKGDIFNYNKIQQTRRKLYQLGFFKTVDVRQYPTAYPNKVDVEVRVEEQRTGTLSLGMGYSTLDKLVGYLEVSQNNLLGRAYRIYIKGEVGGSKVHGEIGFTNPWLFNTPTPFSFYIYDTFRNMEDKYEENRVGFNTSIGRQIKSFNKIYLGFKYEKININRLGDATLPAGVDEGTRTARSVTFNMERDLRNHYYHPTNGYRIYHFNQLTGGPLGGDNHFYKTYIDASIYHPLYWRFVFAMRGNFGLIFKIRNEEVPDYERFYLGGAQDLRGYVFRSIHLANRGGEAQFIWNTEIRFNIAEGLYGALFWDAGNVWYDYNSIDLSNLKYSFGFGFRLDTPLGPLRFDFAWPVVEDLRVGMMDVKFSVGELF